MGALLAPSLCSSLPPLAWVEAVVVLSLCLLSLLLFRRVCSLTAAPVLQRVLVSSCSSLVAVRRDCIRQRCLQAALVRFHSLRALARRHKGRSRRRWATGQSRAGDSLCCSSAVCQVQRPLSFARSSSRDRSLHLLPGTLESVARSLSACSSSLLSTHCCCTLLPAGYSDWPANTVPLHSQQSLSFLKKSTRECMRCD